MSCAFLFFLGQGKMKKYLQREEKEKDV